jgi:outer membrane protein assembly factor BamB
LIKTIVFFRFVLKTIHLLYLLINIKQFMNRYFPGLITAIILLFSHCSNKKTEIAWVQNLPVIGSQSSPRAADLNGDGVLDIIMGAGKNEYEHSDQGILAFDGNTGELIWQQEAGDQVFGSATFLDINGDGVQDVFIGGRSNQLRALDGKTGEVIWTYGISMIRILY